MDAMIGLQGPDVEFTFFRGTKEELKDASGGCDHMLRTTCRFPLAVTNLQLQTDRSYGLTVTNRPLQPTNTNRRTYVCAYALIRSLLIAIFLN